MNEESVHVVVEVSQEEHLLQQRKHLEAAQVTEDSLGEREGTLFSKATVYHEKIVCLKRLRLRVLRRVRKFFLMQNFYIYTCRCKRDGHTQSLEHNLNKISLLASFYLRNCFVIYGISLHILTPSHPHTLTSSHPHTVTSASL